MAIREMFKNDDEETKMLIEIEGFIDKKIEELRGLSLIKKNILDRIKKPILVSEMLSHDFRTPLNAIIGFAEIIATIDGIKIDEIRKYTSYILESSNQLLRMVEQCEKGMEMPLKKGIPMA